MSDARLWHHATYQAVLVGCAAAGGLLYPALQRFRCRAGSHSDWALIENNAPGALSPLNSEE